MQTWPAKYSTLRAGRGCFLAERRPETFLHPAHLSSRCCPLEVTPTSLSFFILSSPFPTGQKSYPHREGKSIRNQLMVHTHVKHGETRGGKVLVSATQQGGAELGPESRSLDPAGCFLGSLEAPEEESRELKVGLIWA